MVTAIVAHGELPTPRLAILTMRECPERDEAIGGVLEYGFYEFARFVGNLA